MSIKTLRILGLWFRWDRHRGKSNKDSSCISSQTNFVYSENFPLKCRLEVRLALSPKFFFLIWVIPDFSHFKAFLQLVITTSQSDNTSTSLHLRLALLLGLSLTAGGNPG